MRSPSSIGRSGSSSSSSSSGSRAGRSPSEQSEMERVVNLRSLRSSRVSSRETEQQLHDQRDILISQVAQSVSGLSFLIHECPIITFCLPSPVAAKKAF